MKKTIWTELDFADCTVVNTDRTSVQIMHSKLKRALWFIPSLAGNLYWRNTGKESDSYAYGYIIKNYR